MRTVTSDQQTAQRTRGLVVAAAQGDSQAWAELVDSHLAEVWQLATAHGGDRSQARLICEMVWLRLAEQLPADPGAIATAPGRWFERTTVRERLRIQRLQRFGRAAG